MPQQTKAIPRLVIAQSELFQTWPAEDVERLIDAADLVKLQENEIIHRPGDLPEYLYLLAAGSVRVSTQNSSGRSLLVRLSFPGEFHGLGPLISAAPYTYTVSARKETHLVRIPGAVLMEILRSNGQLAVTMFAGLTQRHRRTVALYADAATHSLRTRIAGLLQSFVRQTFAHEGNEVQLSQDEIAQLLGSRRQVVNRELRTLENLEVLRLEYGRITVTDWKTLNELVERGTAHGR